MNTFVTSNNHIELMGGDSISSELVARAAQLTNERFNEFYNQFPDIAKSSEEGAALSSAMGSLFNDKLIELSNGRLVKNPCHAGHPDILNISQKKYKDYFNFKLNDEKWEELGGNGGTYIFDGIESKCSKNDLSWSAHHSENTNLLGITCDIVNSHFQIVAVMFSYLDENDWTKVKITNRKDSTPVSTLTKSGKEKMRNGWLCVLNEPKYISKYNFESKSGGNVLDKYEEKYMKEFKFTPLF